VSRKAIAGILLYLAAATSQGAGVYELRFYDVDDQMYGYISNSEFTHQLVLAKSFQQTASGDTGLADISQFVRPGANTLLIEVWNGPAQGPFGPISGWAGWTYGWDFVVDGATVAGGQCGTWNSIGCDNSSYTPGLVHTDSFTFTVVPVPTAVWMLGSALGVLGLVRRKTLSGTA
jgi:hypothetical protein